MSMKREEQPEQRLSLTTTPLRTLQGHEAAVLSVAFDASGRTLASASSDGAVKLWDAASGELLRMLGGHKQSANSIAFNPRGYTLASGSSDGTVKIWGSANGRLLRTLKGHRNYVNSVAFDPLGRTVASGSADGTVRHWEANTGKQLKASEGLAPVVSVAFDPLGRTVASGGWDRSVSLWNAATGRLLSRLKGHSEHVLGVAFDPSGRILASCSRDGVVKIWQAASGKLLRTLEGHTGSVDDVAFSPDGLLLASKSDDGTLRLWSCKSWETLSVIVEPPYSGWMRGIAFHPKLPLLATSGSEAAVPARERFTLIRLWRLDYPAQSGTAPESGTATQAVHHTTAKIVLVGDSGVGKTGLGWRLAHGKFKEHASTHGQQFWVVKELGTRRKDETECEAVLWDLAGQPDYRLTHALFLDDADLALVLFDPTDSRDPLHGVEFWLKQLKSGRKGPGEVEDCCPTILVGARTDRGEGRLTQEELDEVCRQRGIGGGYLATSASVGTGLEELLRRMKEQIAWEQKPATVTTVTFKRIKDYVLGLKESPEQKEVIVSPEELRARLQATDEAWEFTDAEMMTAVGHLANYGYVRVLRTSKGGERVLLSPELLNNLAASFVLEARRNPKGLGSLEEKRLLEAGYSFPELEKLSPGERDILLDSAALLFLEHNVCFRETDPLGGKSYLVFPELINLKKPLLEEEQPTEDGAAYTVGGAVENVYASLVVLLGYTQTFTRTDQWRSHARYEVGDRLICGFRQEAERDGELDFVLYFGADVGAPVRRLFQSLFESFLARRNLNVSRFEPVACQNGHWLERAVVRAQLRKGSAHTFCSDCGARTALPRSDEPIQLRQDEQRKVDEQRWFAEQRTRFEQAVFRLSSYAESQKLARPECFVSYAWGERERERWVERNLATDLQKAGIGVVLDRWENERVGASVARFVERIEACDRVIVVGTPLYRRKYENKDTGTGYVVAAEVDVISNRLLGTEAEKESVLPLLLAGDKKSALPPLLQGRVFADFRNERAYFTTAFDLILDLYGIAHKDTAVADLRESLRGADLR
jgi:GTPase SAR1 family protein